MRVVQHLRGTAWLRLWGVVLAGSVALTISNSRFASEDNISVILADAAVIFVIGASQLVVLSVREFNLAVGAIGALTGIVAGYLLAETSIPWPLVVVIALAVSGLCGLANGLIVAWSRVNGFIVTLAMGGVFSGISFGTTSAQAYTSFPEGFLSFGSGSWGFLRYITVSSFIIAVALGVLYRWSRLGRTFLAVGGNSEAAVLSGIVASRVVIKAHVLSGVLAGTAGLLFVARIQSARPVTGANWLIQSFVVPVVGGTSLEGGVVSIAGAVVAAVMLAVVNSGLVVSDVDPYWVTAINGGAIFAAVLLGTLKLRKAVESDPARESVVQSKTPGTVSVPEPDKDARE